MTKKQVLSATIATLLFVALGSIWLFGQESANTVFAPFPQHHIEVQKAPLLSSPIATTEPRAITSTVGTPTSTPTLITVNTPTTVTVTVTISPAPAPNGVNLLRLGATGMPPTILGVMQDDGTGTGTYKLQVPFNESATGELQLQASAAFKGQLQRSLSPVLTIRVWPRTIVLGVALNYPPSSLVISNNASSTSIQTNPVFDATGGSEDDTAAPTQEGFKFTIDQQPPVVGSFDITTWLTTYYPLWQPTSIQPTSLGSKPAYFIPALDPSDADTYIIPTTRAVYLLTFNTSYFSVQADNAARANILNMLSSIQFQ